MAETPPSEVEARIAHLHRVITGLIEERDLATRRALLAEDQAFLRLRADVQQLRDLYVLSRELNWWLVRRHSEALGTWPPAARVLQDALLLGDDQFGIGLSFAIEGVKTGMTARTLPHLALNMVYAGPRNVDAAADPEPLRVYLAARYSRHAEMLSYACELEGAGYSITARWILGDHDLRSGGQSDADEWTVRWAQEDWDDLMRADVVISFTEGPGMVAGRARGGRHVEFGAALAMEKRCIVVGHRENIFHYMAGVEFVPDWPSAVAQLASPQ